MKLFIFQINLAVRGREIGTGGTRNVTYENKTEEQHKRITSNNRTKPTAYCLTKKSL